MPAATDAELQERRIREEAKADAVVRRGLRALRPPPKLRLSEWADREFVLSAESSAQAGPWRTLPYQVGLMDALTDPSVTFWTLMKSARVGATKIYNAAIAYYIDQDPTTIMVVQPRVEDAEGYSKEELGPMLADVPALRGKVAEAKAKDGSNTILHKVFPGGSLSVVGANSPGGFRRVSRRAVLCDEIDGYPPSAGAEGDPVKLALKRTEYYWNRLFGRTSTPTLAGASRIEAAFQEGDRRRYFVPCPTCGHMDILVFRRPGKNEDVTAGRGHWMSWPEGRPEEAHFVCRLNGCVIEHHQKRAMVAAGEWRAEAPFRGHASFHIWAAYSFAPNATWAQIAEEFVTASKSNDVEQLKTFVNTTLGEVWQEKGEAPDWELLHRRRALYEVGRVPDGVLVLTAGVDVQKDRLVYEVVGWAGDKQSWSIEIGVLPGDTSSVDGAVWRDLDMLLDRTWPAKEGDLPIRMLAIDSGWNTNTVYTWGRRKPRNRVMATKGVATQRSLVGAPTDVDVTVSGKRKARGYKVWPVGVNVAKGEFYGWLRLEATSGEPLPAGWCHFPQYDEGYFKQITAEHLVLIKDRKGFSHYEWQLQPGRENHYLDCRILARAAAYVAGLDRLAPPARPPPPRPPAAIPPGAPGAPGGSAPPPTPAPMRPTPRRPGGWLGGSGRSGSWLGRRR